MLKRITIMYCHEWRQLLLENIEVNSSIYSCFNNMTPYHQTKAVKEWLAQNNIELLFPWPENSPDLNPIENCWLLLKRKVAATNPTSLKELKKAIVSVWVEEISFAHCEKLCLSMRTRIANVIANKG